MVDNFVGEAVVLPIKAHKSLCQVGIFNARKKMYLNVLLICDRVFDTDSENDIGDSM